MSVMGSNSWWKVFVSRKAISQNKKHGKDKPVIRFMRTPDDEAQEANGVEIMDDFGSVVARVVYRPKKGIQNGNVVVWIEAKHIAVI